MNTSNTKEKNTEYNLKTINAEKINKMSQGEKFIIQEHLKKLRTNKREKNLNKIISYLEEKSHQKGSLQLQTCKIGQCL